MVDCGLEGGGYWGMLVVGDDDDVRMEMNLILWMWIRMMV